MLRPIQLAMLGGVTAVFGIEFETDTLKQLLKAVTGQGGVEKIGKKAVKLALKHVPGLGAAVNATIAAALTSALGEAYIRVCGEYLRRAATGQPMPAEDVVDFLLQVYGSILKARPIPTAPAAAPAGTKGAVERSQTRARRSAAAPRKRAGGAERRVARPAGPPALAPNGARGCSNAAPRSRSRNARSAAKPAMARAKPPTVSALR